MHRAQKFTITSKCKGLQEKQGKIVVGQKRQQEMIVLKVIVFENEEGVETKSTKMRCFLYCAQLLLVKQIKR